MLCSFKVLQPPGFLQTKIRTACSTTTWTTWPDDHSCPAWTSSTMANRGIPYQSATRNGEVLASTADARGLARRRAEAVQSLRGPSDLLFPSQMRSGRPLTDMALTKCLRNSGLADRTLVHGFRTSFRTWASERTSVPHAVAETALADQVGSAVERSDARSDLCEATSVDGSVGGVRKPAAARRCCAGRRARDTPRGSARRFIRRFASTVDSVAVGTWESSNPRFDLAFRPSNGRPTNLVRFRKFAGAHHPVDGGSPQASPPLNLGTYQQSIRRIDGPFHCELLPYHATCDVTVGGAGANDHLVTCGTSGRRAVIASCDSPRRNPEAPWFSNQRGRKSRSLAIVCVSRVGGTRGPKQSHERFGILLVDPAQRSLGEGDMDTDGRLISQARLQRRNPFVSLALPLGVVALARRHDLYRQGSVQSLVPFHDLAEELPPLDGEVHLLFQNVDLAIRRRALPNDPLASPEFFLGTLPDDFIQHRHVLPL